ncbi:hypothetical protein [Mycoplasma phocimorsus]|uniref:hypothetical protein n=1 Tax=Mycoplasma phocimorsus TaxID=3045839 RepID=UPI0024BF5443|nr:hypothetical protein [Mycoplasma phocimorsus]MDJ1646641.1 hypothetical protein [Mycoplasma phocimorsus]MDJ1647311.1 hypothetical protein [Mycoplasma phocimorsus]MDJ1647594.1 hypothetical protein [Mycoplasma phocimorsus]MDJ1648062.1 hypothetical protein [Mycoplasma phocimorsus]MDJ1648943.1 hypothetical protein [Mycoplasma phocimorsus]
MSYIEYNEVLNNEKNKLFYSKKTLIFRVLLLFTFIGALVFLGNISSNMNVKNMNKSIELPIWVYITFAIFMLLFIAIASAFFALNIIVTKNLNKQFFANKHFKSYSAYDNMVKIAGKEYDNKIISVITYCLITGFIINGITMFIYSAIKMNFKDSITVGLGVIFIVIAAIIGIIYFINRSKYVQTILSKNWEKLKV